MHQAVNRAGVNQQAHRRLAPGTATFLHDELLVSETHTTNSLLETPGPAKQGFLPPGASLRANDKAACEPTPVPGSSPGGVPVWSLWDYGEVPMGADPHGNLTVVSP